jgi:hypothetical protein
MKTHSIPSRGLIVAMRSSQRRRPTWWPVAEEDRPERNIEFIQAYEVRRALASQRIDAVRPREGCAIETSSA